MYNGALDDFEKSHSNFVRSVVVCYSGGIRGKKKYRVAYRDVGYQRNINNVKYSFIRVNNCNIPRLVPYNNSVRGKLCEGLKEEKKVFVFEGVNFTACNLATATL